MRSTKKSWPRFAAAGWLLVVSLGTLGLVGCGGAREQMPAESTESKAATKDAGVRVTVSPVGVQSVQRIVGVVGTLHGYEEVSLGVKVQGRVKRILHDVSDRVQPGELLLEIDPTDYQLNVRQAQRALQAELAKLGLSEVPGVTVDVTRVPMVVQAQLRRDNALTRLERVKSLVARKASAEEDLIEKTSEFRVAESEYENQVLLAKAGIAAIQVKNEALSIAKQQLNDTQIRVPAPSQNIPGLTDKVSYAITARPVSDGSYVMPGAEVLKLVIDRPLKFRGRVPERKISEVQLGQKAHVFAAAFTKPFPGEVTRINPSIDPQTRAFEVEIMVPNSEGELKPGGFAKTGILTAVDDKATTVPLEALVSFAGVTKVFLVEGGVAKEVQVTLGMQGNDWVEIASPKLPPDGKVVTSGQTAIANGTAVSIREASPAASPAAGLVEESAPKTPQQPETEEQVPVARREATP